jgi:hypothetical protein
VIIGNQKSGTTFLHAALKKQHAVNPAKNKVRGCPCAKARPSCCPCCTPRGALMPHHGTRCGCASGTALARQAAAAAPRAPGSSAPAAAGALLHPWRRRSRPAAPWGQTP